MRTIEKKADIFIPEKNFCNIVFVQTEIYWLFPILVCKIHANKKIQKCKDHFSETSDIPEHGSKNPNV